MLGARNYCSCLAGSVTRYSNQTIEILTGAQHTLLERINYAAPRLPRTRRIRAVAAEPQLVAEGIGALLAWYPAGGSAHSITVDLLRQVGYDSYAKHGLVMHDPLPSDEVVKQAGQLRAVAAARGRSSWRTEVDQAKSADCDRRCNRPAREPLLSMCERLGQLAAKVMDLAY